MRLPPVRTAQSREPAGISPRLKRFLEGRILWEDDSILVINKPSGLAVHGGSGVSLGLIEALRAMRPDGGFLELVHRLDRDTSGCLMVAKKRSRLKQLHEALRHGGAVEKVYTALLQGRWKGKSHTLDARLSRVTTPSGERVVRVSGSGRQSLTEFTVVDRYPRATLVEARPITGRTHQIRVHAQFAGHAIAGDEKYSKKEDAGWVKQIGLNRLFLHASRLRIPAADGGPAVVYAALFFPCTATNPNSTWLLYCAAVWRSSDGAQSPTLPRSGAASSQPPPRRRLLPHLPGMKSTRPMSERTS